MTQIVKQVIEVPLDEFQAIKETNHQILRALQNLNLVPTQTPDFITANEWMKLCGISRWKFDLCKASGKLPLKRVGRKYYLPRSAVNAYFNGEYTIDD